MPASCSLRCASSCTTRFAASSAARSATSGASEELPTTEDTVSTATRLAVAPPACPPMPSATMIQRAPERARPSPNESWLFERWRPVSESETISIRLGSIRIIVRRPASCRRCLRRPGRRGRKKAAADAVGDRIARGLLDRAALEHLGAARVEAAARRRRRGRGHVAREAHLRTAPRRIERGHRGEQRARVGMARIAEDALRWRLPRRSARGTSPRRGREICAPRARSCAMNR